VAAGLAAAREGASIKFSHLHLEVRDLPGALAWLVRIWDVEPSYLSEEMAVLSMHGTLVILDAADEDGAAIVGFSSENCDEDNRMATERGAETVDPPADREWGVRAAYLRGPGQITFEIEQDL